MLVGRDEEVAELRELLERAETGMSAAVAVRGEAGIGKTALLDHLSTSAEGFIRLTACGVESEAELPYAVLHQLLRPMQDRIPGLPSPQMTALAGALGLAEGGSERFLVAVATLTLLSTVAESAPVLAIVDDAQFADTESIDVLTFVARRLQAEGVVLAFGVRDEPGRELTLSGVRDLVLTRLADEAAREVVRLRSDRVRSVDEVVAEAAGNPLALLELSTATEREGVGGVESLYMRRVRAMDPAAQTALLVAAAEHDSSLAIVDAAARRLGSSAAQLAEGERSGLIRVSGGRIDFHHPLARSAAYYSHPFAARGEAHLALAEILTAPADADRRAWHRAAATIAADDAVADELASSATRARARGGNAAAASAFERAAELSTSEVTAVERFVLAAIAAWNAGQSDRATALLDRAGSAVSPALAITAGETRGEIELHAGSPQLALDLFLATADAAATVDRGAAVRLVNRAQEAASVGGLFERMAEIADRARALGFETPEEEASLSLVTGAADLYGGDPKAAIPALTRCIELARGFDEPVRLVWGGVAAIFLGDSVTAHRFYADAVALARANGEAGVLPFALQLLSALELWTGDIVSAEADASAGLELARATGQVTAAAPLLAIRAQTAVLRGDEELAGTLADEALALGMPRRITFALAAARTALAQRDLLAGRPAEALERFTAIFHDPLVQPISKMIIVPNLVEAAVRAGRPEDAHAPLAAYRDWVEISASPIGEALLERSRALVSPDDAAEHFEAALSHHRDDTNDFQRAWTELLYGEFLRRERRKTDARTQLRSAVETFAALGAAPLEERARAELRATGETARKRVEATLADLTPQELQIARLAAEGATNREIGAQLFLSPKTVEYHLRKVFSKLQIASRTDLVKAGADALGR